MDPLATLTDLLRELPGIGPRQARRLALWLARRERGWLTRLSETLLLARDTVRVCPQCMRLFPARHEESCCTICSNPHRDPHTLLIVEKDTDLENIERFGVYLGRYFVLGGTVRLLEKNPETHLHLRELQTLLEGEHVLQEIIFACSATTEGEDTVALVQERIAPIVQKKNLRMTLLGRGLSTGTELEYVDVATMKNALSGRTEKHG